MKFFQMMVAIGLTLWVGAVVGVAMADDGAGACVAGVGFSLNNAGTGAGYNGVNVAGPTADPTGVLGFTGGSSTGVYDNEADFEAQCCAETGQAADCFAPVQ